MSIRNFKCIWAYNTNTWHEGILKDCAYPNKLKSADVSPVISKEIPYYRKTIDL